MSMFGSCTAQNIVEHIQIVIEEERKVGSADDYIAGLVRAMKIAQMYDD
jgi:hypothetical protein